jgi:hypothetical protein
MRVVISRVPIAICALIAFVAISPSASADTYQLFNLGPDNSMAFLGLSSSGLAFFESPGYEPACNNDTCYFTYSDGVRISTSATAPTFTVDNGTTCSPILPPGWFSYNAVCNNDRVAFTGEYGGYLPMGVFFTTNPTPPTLPNIGGSGIWMNSIGDVIFDDGFQDNWWEAVDLNTLVTPEPGSLVLLATGILALAIAFRRHISRGLPSPQQPSF